ncbi:MAG: hypothetical protein ACK49V_00505, partial [Actinomycetes bacterium]
PTHLVGFVVRLVRSDIAGHVGDHGVVAPVAMVIGVQVLHLEEVGIDVRFLEVKDLYSDDHGNWRYDTVIAHVTGDVGAHEANYESDEVRWVALSDIESYDLHPGLRNSWPHVLTKLSATLP